MSDRRIPEVNHFRVFATSRYWANRDAGGDRLRVRRDDRRRPVTGSFRSLVFRHPLRDVFELRVSVWVGRSLLGFRIRLVAIASVLEEASDRAGAHGVAPATQLVGKSRRALAGPEQIRLRMSTRSGFQKTLQRRK